MNAERTDHPLRTAVVSSFTVIKGAQVEATYALFRDWDLTASRKANLDRFKATGGTTANWRRDVAKTVNRRFDTEGRDRILVELAQAGLALDLWRPILLWHLTRDEFLVRDFLVNWLARQHEAGAWRLWTADVMPYLEGLHARTDLQIKDTWSPSTTNRAASGLLGFAVDFGLMTGSIARTFVSYHLPDAALLYLLHAMIEQEPNPDRMLHAADWRLYLLSPAALQHELFRLHQLGRLHYEVAGSIAELRLSHRTAADFARAELLR